MSSIDPPDDATFSSWRPAPPRPRHGAGRRVRPGSAEARRRAQGHRPRAADLRHPRHDLVPDPAHLVLRRAARSSSTSTARSTARRTSRWCPTSRSRPTSRRTGACIRSRCAPACAGSRGRRVNGRELVAADVKYTFERAVKKSRYANLLGRIEGVETPDKYTVRVTWPTPTRPSCTTWPSRGTPSCRARSRTRWATSRRRSR